MEGRLRTRKWQDQNGQDRYSTEIQGDVMQMLGSRPQNTNNGHSAQSQHSSSHPVQQEQPPMDNFDDDIPF